MIIYTIQLIRGCTGGQLSTYSGSSGGKGSRAQRGQGRYNGRLMRLMVAADTRPFPNVYVILSMRMISIAIEKN